jgi:hypothetical protein
MGTNFGTSESSSTAEIAGVNCRTTYWSSATQMVCGAQISLGLQKTLVLEVAGITGTFFLAFSYDTPVITSTAPFNIPASAGSLTVITLQGTNFGSADVSPSAYIGLTPCASTKWISTTTTTCNPTPGIGAQVDVNVLLQDTAAGQYVGGVHEGFTYDTPVITMISTHNGPTAGGSTLTLSGTNFGMYDASAAQQAIIAGNYCNATQWVSNTAISCTVPPGVGVMRHVGMLVQKNVGTMAAVFTYDGPILTHFNPANGPVLGGSLLTMHGLNLGADTIGATIQAFVHTDNTSLSDQFQACLDTAFLSANSIVCRAPPGSGGNRSVKVAVSSTVFSDSTGSDVSLESVVESAFSYDAPVVTQLVPSNAPITGGAVLTMHGMNFNATTLQLASGADVVPAQFVSATLVQFTQPSILSNGNLSDDTTGTGLYKDIPLLVDGKTKHSLLAIFAGIFSYDAPVITKVLPPNAPTVGGQILTLEGKNFGEAKYAPKLMQAFVGSTACQTESWLSATSIACQVSQGLGISRAVSVRLNQNPSAYEEAFTYDAPLISGVATTLTADVRENYVLTIQGSGFGVQPKAPAPPPTSGGRRSGLPLELADDQVLASVGEGYCSSSTLLSPTEIACRTIAGPSPNTLQRVSVTVGGNVNTYFSKFEYGTICPSNCSYPNGECASNGECQCKNVGKSERIYQGRDCSLDYCIGSSTLTSSEGVITDHTELRYLYIPWYKVQTGSSACSWLITPNAGRVSLKLEKLDIHPEDALLIYDGKDATGVLLANLTGTRALNGLVQSTGGEMFVTMQTPLLVPTLRTGYTGFQATYNSTPVGCPLGCSKDLDLGTCEGSGSSARCSCKSGWHGEGCDVGYTALEDSFDPNLNDDMWLDYRGAVFSFGCGQQSGNNLFFQGSTNRYIVSDQLDLRHGGYVSFHIRVGSASGPNATCELVDKGEEVLLQWSADSTAQLAADTTKANWTTFPSGSYAATSYQNFRFVQVAIPKEAYGNSVHLRWIQPKHDPVKGKDTWALDSVKVTTPYKCETGIDNIECSGHGTCFATNECQCFDGFVGNACEDACHWNYWHEKVCGCAAPIDPYSS